MDSEMMMMMNWQRTPSRPFARLMLAALATAIVLGIGLPGTTESGLVARVAAQAGNCALPNYPDATCTGVPAGTALTVVTGNMTITTANTIVDGQDIRGSVSVKAAGVVIRNSKITCTNGGFAVDTIGVSGTWLTIQDTTISCGNLVGGTTAIGEEQVTVLRTNISGCENGFDVNRNMLIQDNYIHDLYTGNGTDDPHTDGIQMWSTATGVTIQHNRITSGGPTTSAIISPSQGTLGTIIRDNLFAGGAYTLYCRQGEKIKKKNYKIKNKTNERK